MEVDSPRFMLERFLDWFAGAVLLRRGPILLAVAALVVFCALQLPSLQTDAAPENLIISFGGYEERVQQFRRYFGDTDSVVVLLIEAEDVTQRDALDYVHQISRHFEDEPYVVRLESLTVTPLPGANTGDAEGGLEALEGDPDATEPEIDPRYEEAVQALVA